MPSSSHRFDRDPPRVLAIGDAQRPEFEASLRLLRRSAEVIPCTPDESLVVSGSSDWIVLLSPWPTGDAQFMSRLADAAPEAHHVQLLGVWCEGEERTGTTNDAFQRVFWHAFPRWWSERQGRLNEPVRYRCKVEARDEATRVAIAESLTAYNGVEASRLHQDRDPLVGVWVGSQLSGTEAHRLQRFCERMARRNAPVVALLDFPRPETVSAALGIGAREVFGQPVAAAALDSALGQWAALYANENTGRYGVRKSFAA